MVGSDMSLIQEEEKSTQHKSRGKDSAGIRVLIVDDEPDVAGFVKLKLSMEAPHFAIDAVEGGGECLDFMKDNVVDCILSDYQMPGMNGMELLERLRESGDETPFIFVTGQGNEEVAREAFKRGANDYFTKDMGFAHFPRIINSVEQAVRQRLLAGEKARAEDELLEEKNKLEAMFASIPDGLTMVGPDFRILYQNDRLKEIVGAHEGELCYKAYHKRAGVCDGCQVALAFADGTTHTVERKFEKEGRTFVLENTASPVRDSSRNIIACLEIIKDVTEQKRVEEALKESEKKFRTIFESATDGIVVVEPESRMYYDANSKFCSMLGYSRDEIVNIGVMVAHPEEYLPYVLERFQKAVSGEISVVEDMPVQRKDGSIFFADISGAMIVLKGKKYLIGFFRDVTGRKKAQEELRKLTHAVEQSASMVVITDAEGIIEYVNPSFTDLTGFSTEEVIGTHADKLGEQPPDERERFWKTISSGGRWKGEFHNWKKDGGRLWVIASVAPIRDDRGEITHYVSTQEDITERKKTEDSLRKSEEFLENVIQSIQDGIIVLDRELTVLRINPAIESMFPGKEHIAGGKCYEDLLDSSEPCVDCPSVITLRTGEASRVERARENPAGGVTWEELYAFPLKDRATGEVSGVIEFIRDITARKRSEDELAKTRKRLEMLLAHNPAVIYSCEPKGCFAATYISGNVKENYGYEPEEFMEDPNFRLEHLHPEDATGVMDGLEPLFKTRQHVHEYRFMHRDGTYRWVRDYMNLICDDHGNPVEIIGCMLDIDEIKRHGIRKEEFYSMVSHDLKSPITAIQGYADLIQEGGIPEEEMQAAAEAILSSSGKLLRLVNDFLDISRLEAGKIKLHKEPVDVNMMLSHVKREFSVAARTKGLGLLLEKTEGLPSAEMDEIYAHRAVSNLVQNAINYTQRGGTVTLGARQVVNDFGACIVISVSDTGPGIPQWEQGEVFEMYYRSRIATGVKGSGLGLAIVKAVAEAHGGRVELVSEEGKGSTFELWLPEAGQAGKD